MERLCTTSQITEREKELIRLLIKNGSLAMAALPSLKDEQTFWELFDEINVLQRKGLVKLDSRMRVHADISHNLVKKIRLAEKLNG